MAGFVRFTLSTLLVLAVAGCESGLRRQISHYEKLGDTSSALEYLADVTEREPANPEARFHYGKVLLSNGAFERGRAELETSVRLSARYGEEADVLLARHLHEQYSAGTAALEEGRFDAAVRHLTNAAHVAPDHLAVRRTLAESFVRAGRLDDAYAAYRELLQLAPSDLDALNNVSELALRLERFEETERYAAMHLERLAQNHTSSTRQVRDARQRLVYAYLGRDQLADAERVLAELLEGQLASSVPALVEAFGLEAYHAGRYELAIPYLERAAEWGAADRALNLLGESYYAVADYERMAAVFEQLVARDADDLNARRNLILANEMLGRVEMARIHRRELDALVAGGRE